MVRVPLRDVFAVDPRQQMILAMDRGDRCFVLSYLALSCPEAFDLAVAAMISSAVDNERPPDPV
jgi:hypothetical protein